MRFLFQFALSFLVSFKTSVSAIIPGAVDGDAIAAGQWLVQKLDHFDPSSSRTWWQKYHTNETWFKNSRKSPIFLLIGGNDRTKANSIAEGAFMDYAKTYKALSFQIEHRFYGESRPTDDLTVSNLRFLTVDQALADIAFFVKHINSRYKLTTNNRWVVFGKGYAGSLAAWARLKYPHLIHAAVASSAPLQAETGYTGFDKNIWHMLSSTKASCPEHIHQAALAVENLLKTPNGAETLTKKFKRCNHLDPKNVTEAAFFVESLARHFRDAVESTLNTLITPSVSTYHHTVEELCSLMADTKFGNALDRYAAVHSLVTFGNLFTSSKCKDIKYDEYVSRYTDKLNFGVFRPWLYQRCSELGFFPISSSKNSLFGSLVDIQLYVHTCRMVFGDGFDAKRMNDGVARTNMMYGGLDLETSRTISIGGSLDLWRDLGLRTSSKHDVPVVIINGAGLGADLDVPSPDDTPQLVNARNIVQKTIGEWLSGSDPTVYDTSS